MRALRFNQHGQPSVLSFQDVDAPTIGPDEALVQVHAAGITRFDTAALSGAWQGTLPRTPGRDFAGLVLEGVGWQGKEVWGTGPDFGAQRDGAHAELVAVPRAWLSEKPPTLTMAQAAAVGIPYFAAYRALITVAQVNAGEQVLVTGAMGLVGRAAIQLAHARKATVIGADIVDNAGSADSYIDLRKTDLRQEVQRLTGNRGVDVVLDVVGGALFEPCTQCLHSGGRQVAIASQPGSRVSFDLSAFLRGGLHLSGVSTIDMTGSELASLLDELQPLFNSHLLQAPEMTVSSFEDAIHVYERVAGKQSRLPEVITIRGTPQ